MNPIFLILECNDEFGEPWALLWDVSKAQSQDPGAQDTLTNGLEFKAIHSADILDSNC